MDTINHIACCLSVRDCYGYLPDIFKNLDLLSKQFKFFYVIFVYDNCRDNSQILLEEYKKSSDFYVYIIHNIGNNSPYRTVRIANSRNKCLDVIYNTIKDIDFHIMIDADNVNTSKWNIEVLYNYIHHDNNKWDALSFNRSNEQFGYYDTWALLYGNIKHHCWGYTHTNMSHKVMSYITGFVVNNLNSNPTDSLFECLSAFNGLAIYRTKVFANCSYDGLYQNIKYLISDTERIETVKFLEKNLNINIYINENNIEQCEHIFYHVIANKKNNARIRISSHKYM